MSIPGLVKESFGAVREGVIAIALLILLLNPTCIGTIAKEAGIKKLGDIEFALEQLQASKEETNKAQLALNTSMHELEQLKSQLQGLRATAETTNPAIVGEIARMTTRLESLELRNSEIKSSSETSLKVQEDAIRLARGKLRPYDQ